MRACFGVLRRLIGLPGAWRHRRVSRDSGVLIAALRAFPLPKPACVAGIGCCV